MDGKWEFKAMPMGIKSCPSAFQRMMDSILGGLRWTHTLCFLDDLVIYGRSFEEHLQRLSQVLSCIEDSGFKIKLRKCSFCQTEIKALGHVISAKGIGKDPDKVRAVEDFPEPDRTATKAKRVKHIQSFIGMAG